VAYFVGRLKNGKLERDLALRVVDLKTRKAVTSDRFQTNDVTFDGAPLFYWDGAGKGLYYHDAPMGKQGFRLMRFDPAGGKSEAVLKAERVGVLAVLDREHLAVVDAENRHCGILRLADRTVLPLADEWEILGGQGRRLVLAHRRTREVSVAEFRLPAKK
jgi:hypothetical protein